MSLFSIIRTVSQRLATTTAAAAAVSHTAFFGPQSQAIRTMSKLKTHKGTAKRWKAIANGAFQRRQRGLRHKTGKLSSDVRRGKHRPVICTKGQQWHLDRLLPYAKH
ncbi:hypothetical protein IWW48_002053 [Coemansia sp. RSA 1200]|nr:hypothetical protein IWW48_002053 [Coemansia sp. RSA 1200]